MDNGCDVDRAAVAFDGDQWRETPLSCYEILSTDLEEDGLERYLLCQKYLLQAGADPTIGYAHVNRADTFVSEIQKTLFEGASWGYVKVVSRKTLASQMN